MSHPNSAYHLKNSDHDIAVLKLIEEHEQTQAILTGYFPSKEYICELCKKVVYGVFMSKGKCFYCRKNDYQ